MTRSTPIAMAAVRCETLCALARLITCANECSRMRKSLSVTSVSRPHEGLQALHPFEVGNDHAAGVAENVGNDEDLVPALVEDEVGFGRGRAVRAFGQDAALELGRRCSR